MGAAMWSADPEGVPADAGDDLRSILPATTGCSRRTRRVPWRVVCGGSSCYVEKLVEPFRPSYSHRLCRARLCVGRTRRRDHVRRRRRALRPRDPGRPQRPGARPARATPRRSSASVLGAIAYQRNEVALHTDVSLLPRRQRAWASWNYRIPREPQGSAVLVTYDMNRLQRLASRHRFLVTLNGTDAHRSEPHPGALRLPPSRSSTPARSRRRRLHARDQRSAAHALLRRLLGARLPRGRREERAGGVRALRRRRAEPCIAVSTKAASDTCAAAPSATHSSCRSSWSTSTSTSSTRCSAGAGCGRRARPALAWFRRRDHLGDSGSHRSSPASATSSRRARADVRTGRSACSRTFATRASE